MGRFLRYLTCSVLFLHIENTACGVVLREYELPSQQELSFMKKFGYLPGDDGGYDYAYTPQALSAAVGRVQRFAGLPDTGLLDVETKELFSKKRCGIRDIEDGGGSPWGRRRRKRYVTKGSWNKKRITYRVLNGTRTLRKRRVELLLKKALDVWAPYGQLEFVPTDGAKADIELFFTSGDHGDANSFDGPGNIVAHAFPPPHGGMHFDDDELWGENEGGEDEEVTDFYTVAVHEAGHALGLGHSPVRASIMYPYYRVPAARLDRDDIMGMHELYLKPPAAGAPADGYSDAAITGYAPKATVAEDAPPHICTSDDYDTLAVMRHQIFVFKGKWMWIFRDQKLVDEVYPVRFQDFFRGLPSNVTFIQAIYERKDGNIIIFSGSDYWMVNDKYQYTSHGTLSDYFLPPEVSEVTVAFRSNYNNKTYLFQRDRFYRFDEDAWRMDHNYPKPMSAWRQLPAPIKSAAIWKGDTFFFKGPRFWRFDNKRIIAHENYPLPAAQIWFGCPEVPDMMQYFTYP